MLLVCLVTLGFSFLTVAAGEEESEGECVGINVPMGRLSAGRRRVAEEKAKRDTSPRI
jgi:hypothetical protein